ncbi:hypothetical protein SAMN05192551_101232 [Tindallia magadiensis]|uniref:Flagellar Assembly Protein A N-terminal region domain-containing protein n=1 Tax=Tindallia magadiensis TaxID=69895 RepID=A0A1I3AK22_9FIRM|nr:FapA family protein [Tindallia magadiensis]SFH49681.1 hypothetical protein SAMN05192551_101232 [Tindallia magadiensis]
MININNSNNDENDNIDGTVSIEIDPQKLKATMVLSAPEGDGKPVAFEEANDEIKKAGITFGLYHQAIKDWVENQIVNEPLIIAEAKLPEDGKDGKVKFLFNIEGSKKISIQEDGSVDFKNLNLIQNVEAGQVLAEKIPATEGTPGTNVKGEQIEQKPGKEPSFHAGKNAVISDDGLKILAEIDGQALLRDGKITVSPVYDVPANVDNTTGNIRFKGKVIVRGNVKSGFSIEADGDIEVHGVVEGAILKSNGHIILNRGVQGNNQAELYSKGDLIAKYIENTKIIAGGNIEADCILHSIASSKKKIIIKGKRGLIVGGIVKATEEIEAKVIGSSMGTQTKIEVGIDPEIKEKYDKSQSKLKETLKNLDNLKKTIGILNKMSKNATLPSDKKEMLVRSVKTYEVLKDQQIDLQEEIKGMTKEMENATKGKIHVSSTVHPGVKFAIYNATKHVYDDIAMCTLYYKEGDIVVGMYEK